jgi:hypothetical protein
MCVEVIQKSEDDNSDIAASSEVKAGISIQANNATLFWSCANIKFDDQPKTRDRSFSRSNLRLEFQEPIG